MIELLPIVPPLEDTNEYTGIEFYTNVVQHLIPDIIKIMNNGIPINIDKVIELEQQLQNILSIVKDKLDKNELIQQFLSDLYNYDKEKQLKEIKTKSYHDYHKEYNFKDKVQRSYIINSYLKEIGRNDLILNEWNIKDIKLLNQIIDSKLISDMLNNTLSAYGNLYIKYKLQELAEYKANLYNKNKETKLLDKLENNKIKFNPASVKQKDEFFSWLNIKSESITPKGNSKWDRDELEKLQKLINIELEKYKEE